MTDPTRKLTRAEIVAAWELVLALARAEMEATPNPELRADRARDVEALAARLTEVRDRSPESSP